MRSGSKQKCVQVDVSGHGSHMGMDIAWQLKLRQDGAFLERISGKELNFSSGCNAGPRPTSWEVQDISVAKLSFCLGCSLFVLQTPQM